MFCTTKSSTLYLNLKLDSKVETGCFIYEIDHFDDFLERDPYVQLIRLLKNIYGGRNAYQYESMNWKIEMNSAVLNTEKQG